MGKPPLSYAGEIPPHFAPDSAVLHLSLVFWGASTDCHFNPTRVEFPAACGVKEIGNSIPDTPLLAAG